VLEVQLLQTFLDTSFVLNSSDI